MINGWHVLAAVLACWRLTELVTIDRISEPFRHRFPHYLWGCPRCVSVWCGILVTCALLYQPWLNWPIALSHIVIVLFDWRGARSRWYRSAQPISGGSDLWGGVLDPSRAIDWTTAGVSGGVPSSTWTQCGPQINAYSGPAAQINTAISNCGASQFVLLGPGTFNLTTGITFGSKNNIVLRGSGPNQTKLIFTGNDNCTGQSASICVGSDTSWVQGPHHTANWTAGYAVGTTAITLSDTTALIPNTSLLILDQLDDSNTDTGGIWVNQIQGVSGTDVPSASGRPGRVQEQLVLVTGVSGSTVTISPGLYMPNWRSSQSPGAWWPDVTARGNGIEDLSMDHTNSGGNHGVTFVNAYGNWMRNVRSINANRNHVNLYQAAHITVRDSYFYGTQQAASQSYGIEFFMASDCLVENNIFQHVSTSMQNNGSSSGNVISYNYSIDNYNTLSSGAWQLSDQSDHAAGTSFNLREGNQGQGYIADDVHGTHHFDTFFRNHITGRDDSKTEQTAAVTLMTHSRYYNIVGNVFGTAGYHTNYELAAASSTDAGNANIANVSIYVIGFDGTQGTHGTLLNDTFTKTSLMRWGNYDTVNNTTRFVSSEVPTGIVNPGNLALPPSFYLSGVPAAWWGTPYGIPLWPAVGPDVVGGDAVSGTGAASTLGGHVYKNPARLCYENLPDDPAYPAGTIQLFNANTCYTGGATPVAPRSLIFIG